MNPLRSHHIRSFCRSCMFKLQIASTNTLIKHNRIRFKHHYPITGKISCIPLDESSARAVVFSLLPEERSLLMKELQKFEGPPADDTSVQLYPTMPQLKTDFEHGVSLEGLFVAHQELILGNLRALDDKKLSVFCINAFPFIGFGFLDNFLMIIAGEYIDTTFSAMLGISTMAAAALGNLISDVAGVGSASYVELIASKFGMEHPQMTPQQFNARRTRWTANLGKAIGVSVGCVIGMIPLFFIKQKDKETNEDSSPT